MHQTEVASYLNCFQRAPITKKNCWVLPQNNLSGWVTPLPSSAGPCITPAFTTQAWFLRITKLWMQQGLDEILTSESGWQDLNTGSTEWEVCDMGQIMGWLLWTSVSRGTWWRRMDSVRFYMKGEDSGWVELSFRVSARWVVTNAQTGWGEWIPGHLFWTVHGSLGLLTPSPCAEGLGSWNFPSLPVLSLSSLSQPMPGAEGCPRRILGPAPNHRSWHRVQNLQANTSFYQPDVLSLSGTACPYQLQAPVWR